MWQAKQRKAIYQHTLKTSFTVVGRGLHSGVRVTMSVQPEQENSGYVFIRRDVINKKAKILARWHSVVDTHLCTTIANHQGVRVATVEHLLAALSACGVDNARIVLDGPEVPIMDGSAYPFVELIQSTGLTQQNALRKAIVVKNTVQVTDGDKSATLSPAPEPWIELEIDFDSPAIGQQRISLPVDASVFEHEISEARTFGFAEQIETLQELGYAQGGSLRNAVLVDKDGIVNPEGWRYPDECVRHKYLDCVGDLSLAGARIIGHLKGVCTGHKLNAMLLQELMSNVDAWDYTPLAAVMPERSLVDTIKDFGGSLSKII